MAYLKLKLRGIKMEKIKLTNDFIRIPNSYKKVIQMKFKRNIKGNNKKERSI